ncbi:MAG: cupin domain-containing protein [Bryobacteraceae bacterium]
MNAAALLALAPAADRLSFVLDSKTVAWAPMSLPGVPAGLIQKSLHNNQRNQLTSALVKFPKGFREPRHYHTTCGHSMYILKGRLRSPEATLTPGMFIYAAVNERHGPFVAEEETEFLFYTDGPFDFFVEN